MKTKQLSFTLLIVFSFFKFNAQNYIINTVAGTGTGGYSGDGDSATVANVYTPTGVAIDASGNVYIADQANNRIRKINTNGIITTIAGTGTTGNSGDGGPATSANLSTPFGVAVDALGNVYLSDQGNINRIRKINTSGVISTIAGANTAGYSGDGSAATSATLDYPSGLAVDVLGNVFIADRNNHRVRKIDTNGIISTIAGTGTGVYSGDGDSARLASVYYPFGVAIDASGNLYIADYGNRRIRKVDTNGIISTIAGTGTFGPSTDGGAATSASLYGPTGVAVDAGGNVYITERDSNRIRKVNTSGIISTIAGQGGGSIFSPTYGGDGGIATSALLGWPTGLAIDAFGNMYVADYNNNRVRKLTKDAPDVWPGDANSDGLANNLDVLELGLHYLQTGPSRASVSISWQSFQANNWTGTISNGQNLNHSDCNGDGTINNDDTLAIYNNYGLTHAFKQNTIATTNPQLSIVPNENMLLMGYWGSADILLGDASNPINNINGVAFTIDFDNNIMESDSVYLEYTNSFIDASNQNLKFRKLDFANGKLFTATTHTNTMNVSGNGKIGTLHYKIKYPLTQTYTLNIGISQANQSDNAGTIIPLTAGSGTVEVVNGVVGVQSLTNRPSISVSPNPAANELTISNNDLIEKVEITNVTGQVILCEQANSRNHKLNLENISNGVYFVKVYHNAKQSSIKKVVIQK